MADMRMVGEERQEAMESLLHNHNHLFWHPPQPQQASGQVKFHKVQENSLWLGKCYLTCRMNQAWVEPEEPQIQLTKGAPCRSHPCLWIFVVCPSYASAH